MTVYVSVAEDDNYTALAATPIIVTITDKNIQTITAADVTATYGDTGRRVSAATSGDGRLSYAVKSGDAVTVDADSGELTIRKVGTAIVIVTAAETKTYAQVFKEVTVTIREKVEGTGNNKEFTVTFKVVNGSWDDDKTGDKTVKLRGKESDTLKLAATDIPAAGSKPGDGHKAGSWDVLPSVDVAITKDTTYTYSYERIETETSNPGPVLSYTSSAEPVPTAAATGTQYTHDAYTLVPETIAAPTNGTAAVTNVKNINSNTLRLSGKVNHNGTIYPVSCFAKNSFQGVAAQKIVIDLKISGNTETVVFMKKTFIGSGAETLCLKLSSADQVRFRKGAFIGSKIRKIMVYGLNHAEYVSVEKKLRASGYKRKIVKK